MGRPRPRVEVSQEAPALNCLLDTHFVLWIVFESPRARRFGWSERYRPWGISPFTLLEIQFLLEKGQIEPRDDGDLPSILLDDDRFEVDEIPLLNVIHHAIGLSWTRDPFDRLIAAHSMARRVPLVTLDQRVRKHHPLLPDELR